MSRYERWSPWLPPLFILVLFLPALLQPGILHPPLPRLNDATRQLWLWREFWRDEVLAGRLPLWNPFLFLGTPFLGELQSAVFYPMNALFLLFPLDLGFKLHEVASLGVAGYFQYRLCRVLGAGRQGATLGALAFAANGQFVLFAFAGWLNHLTVACWAPAVLWAFLESQRGTPRRGLRYLLLGAAFLALQVYGGHPEWMFYTVLAALALALARSMEVRPSGTRALGGPWLSFAAMAGLAILLSGPQLLPAIEATLQSSRGQTALARAAVSGTGVLPPAFLPTMVVPRLFGPWDFSISVDAWVLKWLGRHITIEDGLMYVGLVPLLLAFFGGRFQSRLVSARVWVILGLGALLLALNTAWLWSGVSWLVPLTRVFRSPARLVFQVSLSASVLASFGATRLLNGEARPGRTARRALLIGAAAMATAGLAGLGASAWSANLARLVPLGALGPALAARQLDVADMVGYGLRSTGSQLLLGSALLVLAVWAIDKVSESPARAWLLLGVAALDLAVFAQPFVTRLEQPARIYAEDLARLAALPPGGRLHLTDGSLMNGGPNVPLEARRRSSGGYDAFSLGAYDDLLAAAEAAPRPTWAAVGVRDWIAPATESGGRGQKAWAVTTLDPVPLVYWTDRAEVVTDRRDALRRLPGIQRGSPPLVLLTPDQPRPPDTSVSPRVAPPVEVRADEPNRLAVRVTAPAAGWLVRSEMFYPGWRAEIDGGRADVIVVNGVMQGVAVPAGRHDVVFLYDPASLRYGFATLALGMLLGAGMLVWSRRPRPS